MTRDSTCKILSFQGYSLCALKQPLNMGEQCTMLCRCQELQHVGSMLMIAFRAQLDE
jgi:hypothetical protein